MEPPWLWSCCGRFPDRDHGAFLPLLDEGLGYRLSLLGLGKVACLSVHARELEMDAAVLIARERDLELPDRLVRVSVLHLGAAQQIMHPGLKFRRSVEALRQVRP